MITPVAAGDLVQQVARHLDPADTTHTTLADLTHLSRCARWIADVAAAEASRRHAAAQAAEQQAVATHSGVAVERKPAQQRADAYAAAAASAQADVDHLLSMRPT